MICYLLLVLGNAADEQTTVVDRHTDAKESSSSDLIVVHFGHGAPRILATRVRHETVAAVRPAEVHHQSELVDAAAALERRHQLVLVTVTGDLTDEDLTSSGRRWPRPVRRRTVLPLTVLLHHARRHNENELTITSRLNNFQHSLRLFFRDILTSYPLSETEIVELQSIPPLPYGYSCARPG